MKIEDARQLDPFTSEKHTVRGLLFEQSAAPEAELALVSIVIRGTK